MAKDAKDPKEREDDWTDCDSDGASACSDRSKASSTERVGRRLERCWEEEEEVKWERRRLRGIWRRRGLDERRRCLREKLEDLDAEVRREDVWGSVVRHCVRERLREVEAELGVEVQPVPHGEFSEQWPVIRVVAGLLIMMLFCLQLYAVHTARLSAESSLGTRYIASLPAVQTFPPLNLSISHLRTPEMERVRGFASIWRMLERATVQSAGDVAEFNAAATASVVRWNEALDEAVRGDVQARRREWLFLGGLVRDLEWAGLSFPRWMWVGGEAMAGVDAATREYREKWVERMRVMEGRWRVLSSGLSGEARVVWQLRHTVLTFASVAAREGEGGEDAVGELGEVLDWVGERLQGAVERAEVGREEWLIEAEREMERNEEVVRRVAVVRKCCGGTTGWWWWEWGRR